MQSKIKHSALIAISLMMISCVHPGPVFVRSGDLIDIHNHVAVLHALYTYSDPWKILPDNGYFVVVNIDGQQWSRPMRWELDNRIPLEPGRHWIRMEGNLALAPPFWVAFEIDAKSGHQYSLAQPFACANSFRRNLVCKTYIGLEDVEPAGITKQEKIKGICSWSKNSATCRSDKDCQGGLRCVTGGETGFGMCGRSSKKTLDGNKLY